MTDTPLPPLSEGLHDVQPAVGDVVAGCRRCGRRYDLARWRSLSLGRGAVGGVVGTTVEGKETATHLVQDRLCPCGAQVMARIPLPAGMTPEQADLLMLAAVLADSVEGGKKEMIWALLDDKSQLMTGDVEPWAGKVLISPTREVLEQFQDSLPHSKAKHMHLTQLEPCRTTR